MYGKIQNIIGLKVVAIKGFRTDMRRKKGFNPEFVLFDDKETYIELNDQDYHSYHDCDSSARLIQVMKDSQRWRIMMEDEKSYPDADSDIGW
jgi:hypothetical protein